MTDHADLRAMLEALPNSSSLPLGIPFSERCWILNAPTLVRALLEERDKLKAEVERMRAKPVTPEQLFSSSKVIWEGWVRARDTEQGCVLDLFNYRVDRSRYVRVVEAEQPQKPVHPKWPADPVEPANPAEPISDELRLRCELAATVLAGLLANNEAGGVDGKADIAHSIADALLAEGRGRMAAEREGKP